MVRLHTFAIHALLFFFGSQLIIEEILKLCFLFLMEWCHDLRECIRLILRKRVVIITGEGQVFCGGGDLKVWHHKQSSGTSTEVEEMATSLHGFASITRRHTSLKPMIAAVNGPAYGGGVEILLNCDLVIASQDAVFALPEVKRGIMAGQGGQCVLTRTLQVVNACRHACICCSNLPESVPVFSVLTFTVM